MKSRPVDCARIRRDFVNGQVPAGPAVDEHLAGCEPCRLLFENGAALGRQLSQAVVRPPEPGELFALVERDLSREVGLRARLRALPTRWRAALLLWVALLIGLSQLMFRPRPNLPHFSSSWFWIIAFGLIFGLALGIGQLARGATSPLRSVAQQRLATLALFLLPAVAAALAPFGLAGSAEHLAAASLWGHPSSCFSYGAALVAPFLLLAWLLDRRDTIPVGALSLAGALAGVSANLLLHAHCPSVHLGHLLLGHVTVGVAWALALTLVAGRVQRAA